MSISQVKFLIDSNPQVLQEEVNSTLKELGQSVVSIEMGHSLPGSLCCSIVYITTDLNDQEVGA